MVGGPSSIANPSESRNMPRGKTNSKVDAKRDALTLTLQETLKGVHDPKGSEGGEEAPRERGGKENLL